jgi:hypothetical protein
VGKGNTRDSYCPIHSFIAECGINQKLGWTFILSLAFTLHLTH